ncbi:DUF3006 domain-containing protein [Tyzzerella sp. OttesenSCG-928-J15]|nr:DUF3006 domain-containing protein [Tyzzerella sp. OttesenSCG-928-J15]
MDNSREYYVIDRIESGRVLVQSLADGEVFIVEKDIFNEDPLEGNVLYIEEGRFITDHESTQERKKSLNQRMNRLFERKKK